MSLYYGKRKKRKKRREEEERNFHICADSIREPTSPLETLEVSFDFFHYSTQYIEQVFLSKEVNSDHQSLILSSQSKSLP